MRISLAHFRLSAFLIVLLTIMHGSAQEKPVAIEDSLNLNEKIVPHGDIREKTRLSTGEQLTNSEFPGSWPMFGTDFRMKIGGYVKADLLYDFDGTTDNFQFLMATIPVQGEPEFNDEGYINLFARETRFNFDIRNNKTSKLPLQLFIEADFWNDQNRLRLRHAYFVVGDFIIGQTWTTLSFLESLPFLIDFAAGDALFGGRTTQIRYQKQLNDNVKLALGLEKLDFLGIENADDLPGKASAKLPLLVARADFSWGDGILFLGSSIGQLRWDGGAEGPRAQAGQWSAVVAGRQYLGKRTYFTWNLSVSKGAGENIMAFAGSSANAVLNSEGNLETIPAASILLGGMHKWSEKWSSNFSYAYGWLDVPDSREPFSLQDGGIAHANLIYRYSKNISGGVEFIYGEQRTSNDAYGNARRIQTMMKFEF
ncbi:DcaP family trimeric outer membrane transporter [Robertkochia aurantiaca]|uniref:DcaP family trimeric outer membrane transporter n=1 Tax=Robertkochia aurantiaca TaxID=2873700 RepID=UPI001CC957E5|nr:DcaP family trimeric outer membrane transporter [Robertkochia sp. 3YJGBD-33]